MLARYLNTDGILKFLVGFNISVFLVNGNSNGTTLAYCTGGRTNTLSNPGQFLCFNCGLGNGASNEDHSVSLLVRINYTTLGNKSKIIILVVVEGSAPSSKAYETLVLLLYYTTELNLKRSVSLIRNHFALCTLGLEIRSLVDT